MSVKHKWHKEIKAWADGAEIEFKDEADLNEWLDTDAPFWEDGEGIEYRIKPQPKETKYLYVYSQGDDKGNVFFKADKLRYGFLYLGKIKLEVDDE